MMSPKPPDPLRGLNPLNRNEIYRELRANAPVYWSTLHTGWVLTRYADVAAVLRHPDVAALDAMAFFESVCRRGGLDLPRFLEFMSSMSFLRERSRHDAIRRLLTQLLAELRRTDITAMIERRADDLLEQGERNRTIDLAQGYGKSIALFTAGTLLGLPEEDVSELGRLAGELTTVFERSMPSVSTLRKLETHAASMLDYFGRQVLSRREHPGQDGVSRLVRLAGEHLVASDSELAGYCAFFFTAAAENTAIAISASALMLLQNPQLRIRLRDDPLLVPAAVRELVRLVTPAQFVVRQSKSDLDVGGQTIRAGQAIILMLGAANRDPEAFPNPDEIDLDRSGPEALSFSVGAHRCLGAQLATLELEVAVRAILNHPRLRLSSDAPVWAPRMNIASPEHVSACFD
jgi:cytochrome P450